MLKKKMKVTIKDGIRTESYYRDCPCCTREEKKYRDVPCTDFCIEDENIFEVGCWTDEGDKEIRQIILSTIERFVDSHVFTFKIKYTKENEEIDPIELGDIIDKERKSIEKKIKKAGKTIFKKYKITNEKR